MAVYGMTGFESQSAAQSSFDHHASSDDILAAATPSIFEHVTNIWAWYVDTDQPGYVPSPFPFPLAHENT